MSHGMDRLQQAIDRCENPTCLGIDPRVGVVPDYLWEEASKETDNEADRIEWALTAFGHRLIEATADLIPAIKPQFAYFESFGIPGLKAAQRIMRYAAERGILVIADAKRGDIGSTSEAYANAFIGQNKAYRSDPKPAFPADIVTVQPYTAEDGVRPFLDAAVRYDTGLFVLCRTSNPSAGQLQDLVLQDGRKVMEAMAELIDRWGRETVTETYGLSAVGAVVGATYPDEARALRRIMPHTCFLIPGYGAQGGTADDAVAGFREDGRGGIVNASRSIAQAYKKFGMDARDFAAAARKETLDMKAQLTQALNESWG